MNRERYREIVKGFAGRRIVVVGDLMMDEYLWGRATRISPESPVMVVEVDRENCVPGGAANVVNNLLTLGARVVVIGVVGADEAGAGLKEALGNAGADVSRIATDSARPTTRKTRVVAHSQQVLRIDREQTQPVSSAVSAAIINSLRETAHEAEAFVISDYSKGTITAAIAESVILAARNAGAIVTANPKPATARMLNGADLITLNQVEAEALTGLDRFTTEDDFEQAAASIRQDLQIGALVVTRGPKGLSIWRDGSPAKHLPAHPVEVYDVAGAGDTVISVITLGLAGGAEVDEAAEVANHAAACVVRKLGVATVTREELIADWWDNDKPNH